MASISSINNEIMSRLEQRAGLKLTETERTETIAQMNAVLSCLDALCLHSDSTLPEESACCPLREDEVRPSAARTATLSNAPDTDGEYFLVPRTVE